MGEAGAFFFFSQMSNVPPAPPFPQTLLDWLAARYPAAKRQTLRRMLQAGRVTINGRQVVRATRPVSGDDQVVVSEQPRDAAGAASRVTGAVRATGRLRATRRPGDATVELDIVYEDADVLVVHKPAGVLTSTVPRERRPTLLAAIRARGAERGETRIGLIHRLDRDASGLLVFSKTHEAYLSLKRQFFAHTVERVYTAVVEGVPTPRSGRVQSRLVERADGTVYSTPRPGVGERAVTDYEAVEERTGPLGRRSLVRVTLQTGRKHQIRVHLSERGAPVVGDPMYAGPARNRGGKAERCKRSSTRGRPEPRVERLMLAATKLAFDHPRTGQRIALELPMPPIFSTALGTQMPGAADRVADVGRK